jgi:hypothetical protein
LEVVEVVELDMAEVVEVADLFRLIRSQFRLSQPSVWR